MAAPIFEGRLLLSAAVMAAGAGAAEGVGALAGVGAVGEQGSSAAGVMETTGAAAQVMPMAAAMAAAMALGAGIAEGSGAPAGGGGAGGGCGSAAGAIDAAVPDAHVMPAAGALAAALAAALAVGAGGAKACGRVCGRRRNTPRPRGVSSNECCLPSCHSLEERGVWGSSPSGGYGGRSPPEIFFLWACTEPRSPTVAGVG